MQSIAIIFLCVFSAVVYGILHDQITARICVEYFTIGHPPVFGTDDPTLLGLGWGVIATWWVGCSLAYRWRSQRGLAAGPNAASSQWCGPLRS